MTELVTNRLRQENVLGHFGLGDGLSESRIARRYEVSRTPVREAFTRLEQEGLVRTEPQSGTYVFTMDESEFIQFSETRSILEVGALNLAMKNSSEELTKQWEILTEEMTEAVQNGDKNLYSAADSAFHEVLFLVASNPYLDVARRPFTAKMDTIRNKLGSTPEHMKKSYREHVDLLKVVAKGDVKTASTLLDQHIRVKGPDFWTVPDQMPQTRWHKMQHLLNATKP